MKKFTDLKFQEKRFLDHLDLFSSKEQERILCAYSLAKKYHRGQERAEGSPYVIHGLRVASCLLEELDINNSDVICAALLHDTVEDTKLSLDKIAKQLGQRTAEMVKSLTRKKREDETPENKYQRKYQKFLELMKKDEDVRSIKACDCLDNMRSWPYLPKGHPSRQKFPRWFREGEKMYIPLAQTVDKRLVSKMRGALAEARRAS